MPMNDAPPAVDRGGSTSVADIQNAPTEVDVRDLGPALRAPSAPDDPRDADNKLESWLAMLIMAASLVMVLWNMQIRSLENANTGSRYATIESLVDYGTYNIDASRYSRTPDKVKARGHWVSSKPPLLPTYGAGIYWVIKKTTGYTIADHEGIVVWTVGMLTGWLSHFIFLIYFYRLSKLLLKRRLAILVALIGAGFAYLGVAYATAINNHSVGAAFQVMGFYYAFRVQHDVRPRLRHWLTAGLVLGVLPALDLPSLAFTAFAGLYLLVKDWKRTLLVFAPAVVPGLALQFLLAHKATGSWLPAYADAALTGYAGNLFRSAKSGIEALHEPKTLYAFNVLLGHHGVFSMTPLFCFGLFEAVRRFVKRDTYRPEIAVWMATLAAFLYFYIKRTTNYGGWCVGMRWIVPVMPWLLMLFALWLDRTKLTRVKQVSVLFAFLVSAYNVQDGLSSPFQFSVWHNFLDGEPNRGRIGPTWNLGHNPPAKGGRVKRSMIP